MRPYTLNHASKTIKLLYPPTPKAIFITGTDTGVGKTYIACKVIKHYIALGYKVVGMKPIAAGCDLVDGEWVNDDVLRLEAASNVKAPRALINPYSFKPAIAPHIAAELAGIEIDIDVIKNAYLQLQTMADIVIIEGAGGLLVPINCKYLLTDLIYTINAPILIVSGIRLGCISHTLLTFEAIKARNLAIFGWVANVKNKNMRFYNNNIVTISQKIGIDNLIY
jgi:dethiobiotin synthetase